RSGHQGPARRGRLDFSACGGRQYQCAGGDGGREGLGPDPRSRPAATFRPGRCGGALTTRARRTMATDTIRHWRIGDVEIARIVEVDAWEDDITMLLPEATPAFVQQFQWLRPHFATADGRMLISFQCFVLRSQGRNVMIDTCIGAERDREFPVFTNMQTSFLEDLAAAGFPHASITDVLCTHLHFDHVGWNTRKVDGKWVPTF